MWFLFSHARPRYCSRLVITGDASRMSETAPKPAVAAFFDRRTWSCQYVVSDPLTRKCAIVDPVLDYDERSGSVATTSAEAILRHIEQAGLSVQWILDTHPHADHFSAADFLKAKTGAPKAIGAHIVAVQHLWREIYNFTHIAPDGSQWDKLFADDEVFRVGEIDGKVLHTPGHTLASVTYVIGDAAFVNDTLFMPDSGTARADFPGGSAAALWRSIQKILALPPQTRLFTGHDYQPGGRAVLWESSVAEQKAGNIHISRCPTEAEFVAVREARDRTLPLPKLILHALQININGGCLPQPETNGMRYLKLPLNAFPKAVWG
jgi:glyoxylase-like metal-dependent hydrolase (beta-lactamase superfamily II)